jgi:beta-N-acetylhexosaminidase
MMMGHLLVDAIDDKLPTSLSPSAYSFLRSETKFTKITITDDLEMKAVADRYSTVEKARRTLLAGVDIALVCHDSSLQAAFFETFVRLQEKDRVIEGLARATERRLARARSTLAGLDLPPVSLSVVGSDAHQELARRIELAASVRAAIG